MKAYEAFLVFAPEATEEGLNKQVARVDGLIEKFGGKITQKDDLGRKVLGYYRKKQREGNCFLYDVQLDPAKVVELRKSLELETNLIHYLWTVKPAVSEKKPRKKSVSKSTSQSTARPPASRPVNRETTPPRKSTAGAK